MTDLFKQAESEFMRLRGQLSTGHITAEQYAIGLQQLRVQDAQGCWWTLHPDSGTWLLYNGHQWVAASPVPPAPAALAVQPSASVSRSFPIGWVAVLAGILVACALIVAVLGLGVSQGAVHISLLSSPTPLPTSTALPTATFRPTIVPVAAFIPTATSTPTTAHTSTSTPSRTLTASPTGTSAVTRTFTPTPLPPAVHIAFQFDEGVPQSERAFFQQAMTLAQSHLGDVGPVTFFAYANFNNLADDVDKFYKRSAASQGSRDFREMMSTGKWIANGGSGAISVWLSDRWNQKSEAFRLRSLIHEYYHLAQSSLAKKGVANTGPIWLYEGATEFVANRMVVEDGIYTWGSVRGDKLTQSRGMLSPLNAMITLQDTQLEDTEYAYTIGFLATEYLLADFSSDPIGTLKKYYQAQGAGSTWQDAFKATFGLPVDEFYLKFEQYRAAPYPPACGPVGVPPAQATPAAFGVQFARKLAPGGMPRFDSPWSDPPNIPYIFCASGVKLPTLSSSVFKFPTGYGGWVGCGANCITVYMRPSSPAGKYTFAIALPDGRRAEVVFDHSP